MEREPTTPEQRRRLLEQCMAAMAAGDAAFMFTFLHEFGPQVERVVRSIVAEMGRRDVLADPDEVHGLVQDAVMVVFERSPGWRPDGALPWTWAYRAIRAEVARRVGHRTIGLQDGDGDGADGEVSDGADLGGGAVACLTVDDVSALEAVHADVALVIEAIRSVGSSRDQRVFLEYALQRGLGDPSASQTVAAEFGLTEANVRQIARRQRQKVRTLLEQPPYAPVRDAAIFAS
ncbi:MAG: sigma-70 family RNA polymerase sigma factor [Acidimicrobiales bacterium]|nr:sigma-70 family RNA polymerase sigma factor [Acidimicrobiales bacterium]